MRSIETWETKGAGGLPQRHAGISPERFGLALRLYRVPDVEGDLEPRVALRDALDAYEWVSVVARAISDAPNEVTRAVRERREAEGQQTLDEIKALMAAKQSREESHGTKR